MYANDANKKMNNKVILPKLSYKIYGLLYEIHNNLRRYKNEQQYCDAFEIILKNNKINYLREKSLDKSFNGEKNRRNIPDFIIENKIIIDFKAKRLITKNDYYQMQRYLKSANIKLGLIVNFRQKYLKPKRIINSEI